MEKVKGIQKLIDEKKYEDANRKLEELYRYKPVRLSWYHLKGQLKMHTMGELGEYSDVLKGKISYDYPYESVEDCIRQYEKIAMERKSHFEMKRYQYLMQMLQGDFSFVENSMGVFEQDISAEKCDSLQEKYLELYAMGEYVIYELQRNFYKKIYPEKANMHWYKWIRNGLTNMGYWSEVINSPRAEYFVVMESDDNSSLVHWICYMLQAMDKKVIVLKKPIQYQNDIIDIQQTITISIENVREVNNTKEIVPIEIIKTSGEIQNNIEYILRYIYNKYCEGKGFHILASGWQTEEICLQQKGLIRSFRISVCTTELLERTFMLSFYGEYLSYVSRVHQVSCKQLLSQPTQKKFSIVIPARNSAYTLEYTIKTCLEQNYKGEYEIIISDNSTGGNTEVFELCERLNDPRIVYIKTPRDLHLPKSFEYAYLHTRGEYVLALGSDDGLLPWALEILDAVTDTYPNEKIVQWERGFYAWPGFNGGQQHQFIIPGEYEKGKLRMFYREREAYLNALIDNPQNMYMLPMLYINSCFRRDYMYDLLQKTGRLWDGICQDIYMGIVTALINPRILNMRYPLSIAGMSSGSIGANANKGITKDTELKSVVARSQKDNNAGGFCSNYMERLIPNMGTDVNSLYNCLLRMISVGVLSEEELGEKLDWQKVYINLYRGLDVRDVAFDKKIHEMRYAAGKHGDDFLQWFDKEIYNPALDVCVYDEVVIKETFDKKTYTEGTLESGGCILDASKRGVFDIFEAVKLFAEMTKL